MEGAEEKTKVPDVPEILKKKLRNLAELEIKSLRRKMPKRCFERQGGSLSMKKLSTITKNTGRCTETRSKWLEWHEKLANSMYLQNPNWHQAQTC